jgi:hypothetical protein
LRNISAILSASGFRATDAARLGDLRAYVTRDDVSIWCGAGCVCRRGRASMCDSQLCRPELLGIEGVAEV